LRKKTTISVFSIRKGVSWGGARRRRGGKSTHNGAWPPCMGTRKEKNGAGGGRRPIRGERLRSLSKEKKGEERQHGGRKPAGLGTGQRETRGEPLEKGKGFQPTLPATLP